jgi:hypothetical protein
LYYYPNLLSCTFQVYSKAHKGEPIELSSDFLEREHLFDEANIYWNNWYDDIRCVYSKSIDPWIVLTNTGALYGKGANSRGQLGDGTKIERDEWVKIADNVCTCGFNSDDGYYFYIKTDGAKWEWYENDPTPKLAQATAPESQ